MKVPRQFLFTFYSLQFDEFFWKTFLDSKITNCLHLNFILTIFLELQWDFFAHFVNTVLSVKFALKKLHRKTF